MGRRPLRRERREESHGIRGARSSELPMRRWISLGGWCGPSLMLAKLGLRPPEESLPFDMVRCTFDGLVELTANGFSSSLRPLAPAPLTTSASPAVAEEASSYVFSTLKEDGYFPSVRDSASAAFTADPVSIWMLFRSQHACFAHFDLNDPGIQTELQRRIRAWELLLSGKESGTERAAVTFLRTVIAEDPAAEIEMLPRFHEAVRGRTRGRLAFRTVLVVHDQAGSTGPLCAFPRETADHQTPCIVWNIKRKRPAGDPANDAPATSSVSGSLLANNEKTLATAPTSSLLDECHDGYQTVLTTMSKEVKWRTLESTLPSYEAYMRSRGKPFDPYTELSKVAGVPAIRGTCTGFGSTFSAALGRCVHCGCTDGHAVQATLFDTNRKWRDEEVDALLLQYAMNRCDEVAAVEAAAQQHGRSAHETWVKLRALLSD